MWKDVESLVCHSDCPLSQVAKSGEVWCEGARIFMNPLGHAFNLQRANKCLEFAVHLTPQYGDSFLELLRLRFLLELRAAGALVPEDRTWLGCSAPGGPQPGLAPHPPPGGRRLEEPMHDAPAMPSMTEINKGVTVAGVLSKIQPAERREGVKKSLGARSLRLSRLRPPRGRCRASLRFRPGA
eukprot:g27339.t1